MPRCRGRVSAPGRRRHAWRAHGNGRKPCGARPKGSARVRSARNGLPAASTSPAGRCSCAVCIAADATRSRSPRRSSRAGGPAVRRQLLHHPSPSSVTDRSIGMASLHRLRVVPSSGQPDQPAAVLADRAQHVDVFTVDRVHASTWWTTVEYSLSVTVTSGPLPQSCSPMPHTSTKA